jgi:flagellar biogenesis protein FliO
MSRRASAFLDRVRATTWLVAGAVFGIALFVFIVVLDTRLIVSGFERSEPWALPAVLIGVAAALATVLVAIWFSRRANELGRFPRRVMGMAGIAWAVVFVILFVVTHPRGRDEDAASSLEVGAVSYVLAIVVAAVAFLPVAIMRFGRRSVHKSDDRVRVMHVAEKTPFYVASCDCGWVGAAYDETEPGAREEAFSEARAHGTNVAPEVERPLG